MSNNIGSFWNKWDLHIHSPYTNMNNRYNCGIDLFCQTVKDKDIKVIGLTNYFIIQEIIISLPGKIVKIEVQSVNYNFFYRHIIVQFKLLNNT